MSPGRINRYPENPHRPGSFLAAQWDLGRALDDLGAAIRKAWRDDVAYVKRLIRGDR